MFKDRLREALDHNGMKAIDLATLLGISRGTVSEYLSGVKKPRDARLHQIALILDVNDAWLDGYDDVPMERSVITAAEADEILKDIRSLSPDHQRIVLSLLKTLKDQDK